MALGKLITGLPALLRSGQLFGSGAKAATTNKDLVNKAINLFAILFGASEISGAISTGREQGRQKLLGEKNIELLIKQLTAQTQGGKDVLEFNRETTTNAIAELRRERERDRSERSIERADFLESQNQQQQLSLIATLIQGINQQGVSQQADRQAFSPTPPLSVVNLMRGRGF